MSEVIFRSIGAAFLTIAAIAFAVGAVLTLRAMWRSRK